MATYSQDLRERAVAAAQKGEQSQAQIAALYDIHLSTLEKWLRRKRETGSCAARPHAGGVKRTLQDCARPIRAAVRKQPDITLAELCEQVQTTHGVMASLSMMCRELQRLALPRKKSRSGIANGAPGG
jgi:transposase